MLNAEIQNNKSAKGDVRVLATLGIYITKKEAKASFFVMVGLKRDCYVLRKNDKDIIV